MLRQNADMREEEIRNALRRKEVAKKMLEEVAASNAEQIELKKKEQDKDREEDLMIKTYLRDRELRDQKRLQVNSQSC